MKPTNTLEVSEAFLEAVDTEADSVVIAFSADKGPANNYIALTNVQKELAICAIRKLMSIQNSSSTDALSKSEVDALLAFVECGAKVLLAFVKYVAKVLLAFVEYVANKLVEEESHVQP